MSEENRRHPRVDVKVPVNVSSGENSLPGTITNLSDGGAALEFIPDLGRKDIAFEIGNSVEIDSDQTDRVPGSVVRSYDGGFAMKFEEDDPGLLEQITDIVNETKRR
jgi:hypothetical protein